MKATIYFVLALTVGVCHAQVEQYVDYKARAERNLKVLVKDSVLLNQVSIKKDGIYLYDQSSTRPEFILYWKEVGHFLRLFYNLDYYMMLKVYREKKTSPFYLKSFYDYIEYSLAAPTSLGGLRVAIDPGHFAGTWDEALYERRYVKVKPDEIGMPESAGDQRLMESELNLYTAKILADTLRKLGANVMLTREHGISPVGKTFETWYKEDFEKDLEIYVHAGDISENQAAQLRSQSKAYVFENFYKYIDFVKRSRAINDFKPDLTLVIHYNADENNPRVADRYTHLTSEDYSMVFIPGAFVWGELNKQDSRLEFLRLLVSPDLEESQDLATHTIKNLARLQVPPIPEDNGLMQPKKFYIQGPTAGVYHRNIYLTRAIEGPVVYVEALYQDNKHEFAMLVKHDFSLYGEKVPKRCAEVAYTGLLATIKAWLEDNTKRVDLVR